MRDGDERHLQTAFMTRNLLRAARVSRASRTAWLATRLQTAANRSFSVGVRPRHMLRTSFLGGAPSPSEDSDSESESQHSSRARPAP